MCVWEEKRATHTKKLAMDDDEAADLEVRRRLQSSGIFQLGAPHEDVTLRLRVADGIGGGAETGGRVWSAALGLSAYLLSRCDACSTLPRWDCVMELGAGPGLPGLMLAALGAAHRVCLTDAVPVTLQNLEHNRGNLPPAIAERVHVAHLDWRDLPGYKGSSLTPEWTDCGDIDLLLAADVVYEPTLAEPLLNTLVELLRRAKPGSVALLAAERRGGAAWPTFEALLRREAPGCGLRCVDRSADMKAALLTSSSFFCPRGSIERLTLLELSMPPKSRCQVVARLHARTAKSANANARTTNTVDLRIRVLG